MRKLRIIFMGTPDFAVPSLDILVKNNYQVVAVVTVADKPAGRGKKLQQSAVKRYATENDIPVLQPTNLKSPEFIAELNNYKPNLFVVVAFRMLPESVWALPEHGTFNLHGSLLPNYRGAAPINWAVINGEKKTGVTTFFIEKEIDTGNIIFKDDIEISNTDNAGSIHDKLMFTGAELVLKTVKAVESDTVQAVPQSELSSELTEIKPAPKIFKENCKIDWSKKSADLYNFIRGLSPYPTAWTTITNGKEEIGMKIYQATITNNSGQQKPGSITVDSSGFFTITTADGALIIEKLQLAGKKPMIAKDFLNGFSQISEYSVV